MEKIDTMKKQDKDILKRMTETKTREMQRMEEHYNYVFCVS